MEKFARPLIRYQNLRPRLIKREPYCGLCEVEVVAAMGLTGPMRYCPACWHVWREPFEHGRHGEPGAAPENGEPTYLRTDAPDASITDLLQHGADMRAVLTVPLPGPTFLNQAVRDELSVIERRLRAKVSEVNDLAEGDQP